MLSASSVLTKNVAMCDLVRTKYLLPSHLPKTEKGQHEHNVKPNNENKMAIQSDY